MNEICFTCGEIYWDAVQGLYPRDLVAVFSALVTDLGLQPEQDWRGKLSAALAAETAAGRALPPPDPADYRAVHTPVAQDKPAQ